MQTKKLHKIEDLKKKQNIKISEEENILENKSKKLLILGGKKLKGIIKISPAKNAILPLIAALLVTKDSVIIPNSNISDYITKLKLLELIGYKIKFKNHEIEITPSNKINNQQLPIYMIQSIRSSILFFGPLLALQKEVRIHFPGGDDLKRNLNFHLECLEKMGAKITIEGNIICGKLDDQFKSTEYTFQNPSVGATQHMIISAILAKKGEAIILNNCAQEPECIFIINFLKSKLGADIRVNGTQITIIGNGGQLFSNQKKPHEIQVPQDRIEALTYLTMSLMTDGEITIDFDDPFRIIGAKDLDLLIQAGGTLKVEKNFLTIKRNGPLKAVKYFESGQFPNISTDFCPIFCALMGMSEGTSIFTETIYGNNRFKYIEEINKFGGVFRLHNNKPGTIVIDGSSYFPSESNCTDIRGGIALLLAALTANGCSTIHNAYHIFRGYQYLTERINSLGGQIKIID